MNGSKQALLLLSCGCQVSFPMAHACPKVGEVIACRWHNWEPVVVKGRVPEWEVNCTECTYHRYFGQAKVTALTSSDSHSVRKEHTVDVLYDGNLMHTSGGHKGQLRLDLDFSGKPPF